MGPRKRLSAYFTGVVQGVGFRYHTKSLARNFEVCGWVRNLSDGRVELIAEGSKDELNAFLQAIRSSRLGPNIQQVEEKWSAAKGLKPGFEIEE